MTQEVTKYLAVRFYDSLILKVKEISQMYSDQEEFAHYLRLTKCREVVSNTVNNVADILQEMPATHVPSFILKLQEELELKRPAAKIINQEMVETYYRFLEPYIYYVKSLNFDNYLKLRVIIAESERNKETAAPPPPPRVKILWKGQAKVLYDLFAQCIRPPSGKSYIENTQIEVAEFIVANFEGITAKASSIATELGKIINETENRPMPSKRTNIKENLSED